MCRRGAKQCNDDVLSGRFLGRFKGPSESQARTWCSSRTCNKQTPRLSFAFQSEQRESGHTYNKLVSCLVTWEAFKTRQFRQCSLDQLRNQSQQDSPRMMSNNFEGSPHLLSRSPSCCPPFWPPRHHARGGTSR